MDKMDGLLAKYMLGEATPAEKDTVDQWIKESELNQRYFTHFKLIWENAASLKTESSLDPDQSWEEFKKLAGQPARPVVKTLKTSVSWLRMAAIWLAVFSAAGLLYTVLKPGKPNMLTVQTGDKVKTDTLSDGSVITLNRNSALTYPDKFTGGIRAVKLNRGEAFFSVAHDKSKPFIITVNDLKVQVVGTSFNIKRTGTATEVIVETGIVQVSRQKVVIRLKRKEKVNADSGGLRKGVSTDELYNYYRTQEFVANKTPLWRIVQVLNEAYKVNIVIADKRIAQMPITTTFKTNSLNQSLNLIRETLNVRIIRKPKIIIIQ